MQLDVLNELAKAKTRWTEKKVLAGGPCLPGFRFFGVV